MIRTVPVPAVDRDDLPSVSVVVPCYNYARYLRACVESILAQEGVDVDVTIVDDASTDDSVAIATELAADPRVTLIRHTENRGHIQTFNDALDAAGADLVVKMDADDIVPPGALARSARLMRAYPTVSLVYGLPETFETDVPAADPASVTWSVWAGREWLGHLADRAHNVIMQPEVMMRRSALREVGGHRADLPEASDLNLWLRLASVGSVARVNGPVQGFYRVHAQSMQRTIHAGFLSDLRGRVAAFEAFFDFDAARNGEDAQLRQRSRRALAADAVRLAQRALDRRAETEPIAEYLAVAESLDPSVVSSPAWRDVAERRCPRISPVRRLAAGAGARVRKAGDSLQWRRWRRTGL